MIPSPVGAAAASVSSVTAAASTRPLLWSVWLPTISVRPGEEKNAGASPSQPKCSA